MSLKTEREAGGSRVSFLMNLGSFRADQREARRAPKLALVFLFRKVLVFGFTRPIAAYIGSPTNGRCARQWIMRCSSAGSFGRARAWRAASAGRLRCRIGFVRIDRAR